MIKEFEIIDPIPPDLMPEPYEGFLPEFAMFKHEGGGHDQLSHGNWADGKTDVRAGLERLASQFDDFEDFSRAISQDTLRPRAWHIAGKDFQLDPSFEPSGRLGEPTRGGGLFVGSPEYWEDYATGRETVIEFDVSDLTFTSNPQRDTGADFFADQSGNQGFFVKPTAFPKLREVGHFTLSEAKERATQQQKEMPKSKAEARKIWEQAQNVTKHEGGGHDQKTHGNWAMGYNEAERAGIEAMRDRGPTTEQMLAYVRSEGEKVPLTREQARILVLNDEDLYETYTNFIFNRLSAQFPDEDSISPKVDIAVEEDTYLDEFIDIQDVTNEYATEMADKSLNDEEMAQLFDEVYGVSVTTPEGVELQTKVTFALKSGDKIMVRGDVQADGEHVGNFRREFRPEGDTFSVQHELFRIDDSLYRGFGLGKEFLRQSEDWYIARGITQIKTLTGWDGFYTWSKAGFDFAPAITKGAIGLIVNRVENAVLDKTLTLNETDIWNGLLERSTEGLNTRTIGSSQRRYEFNAVKNIRDEDFPLPAEFARAPKAKDILRDLTISMVKYLTPEGRSLADAPIDRDGDGMVFDGTPRERPAKPSELPVAAAKWSARDTKLQAISNAYYKYGKDDFINENEGSDEDNPELDRAIDKILRKSDFMKRLASFSYSVVKHQAGTHDQLSHGNWADGDSVTQGWGDTPESKAEVERQKKLMTGLLQKYVPDEIPYEMRHAVNEYVTRGHILNEQIYEDESRLTPEQKLSTKNLDTAFEQVPNLPDITVFRVAPYEMTEYLDKGDIIELKGYTSGTFADLRLEENERLMNNLANISRDDRTVIAIIGNKGKQGIVPMGVFGYEENPDGNLPQFEREVILPRNLRLEYVGTQRVVREYPAFQQQKPYRVTTPVSVFRRV